MLTKIAIISAISFSLFISSTYFNIGSDDEWEKLYENGSFYSIIAYNHSYVLVGYKWQENNSQGWIVKIDRYGNLIWEKTYGGKGDDGFRKIIKDGKNSSLLEAHHHMEKEGVIFGLLK